LAPYTYSWSPTLGLSNPNAANPIATPPDYIVYTLTVTDDTGAVDTDVIIVYMSAIYYVNAGKDTSVCADSTIQIGGFLNNNSSGVTYSWSPGNSLNDSTLPRPIASPLQNTTYTLTATISGCPPKTDFIAITFIPTPIIDAGTTVTINEGETISLNATGGNFYSWYPQNTLTYFYTANPNAEPTTTTLYTVYGSDPSRKCNAFDTVTVIVIPSESIVIYNTFTPNRDNNNDTWYIGNIHKYPNNTIEVYNRNGKSVYKRFQYDNTWNGRAYGNDLPDGTYFYIIDLGDGKGVHNGTVTIIRK